MSDIPTTTQTPQQRNAANRLRRKQQDHERLAFRSYREGDMKRRERHLCAAAMYWTAAQQHVTHIPPDSIYWTRRRDEQAASLRSSRIAAKAYNNAETLSQIGGLA